MDYNPINYRYIHIYPIIAPYSNGKNRYKPQRFFSKPSIDPWFFFWATTGMNVFKRRVVTGMMLGMRKIRPRFSPIMALFQAFPGGCNLKKSARWICMGKMWVWRFRKMGVALNHFRLGCSIIKQPLFRYPHFRKPSYGDHRFQRCRFACRTHTTKVHTDFSFA